MSTSMIWIGMDVHKDIVMVAVYLNEAREPEIVQQLPNDSRKLKRFFERWSRRGEIRGCYEASGAGYVLQRDMADWGYGCEVVAPSLIPVRPGERRKHDRRDATQLARLYCAGELVAIRIPSAADERVRDLVRCRQCFQRKVLRSRHYVTKFLARRGFVYRQGQNWTREHRRWLVSLLQDGGLEPEDRSVFGEYLALLDYKLSWREADRQTPHSYRFGTHSHLAPPYAARHQKAQNACPTPRNLVGAPGALTSPTPPQSGTT